MSNPIKYSTGSESLALKKGNFYIGTGDVGKGPTSTTGYYNGITPPSGGYTIYLNKATGGPSIYTCANDTELISLTNQIASASYTTANECLNYYNTESDKMCVNRDYDGIVTDGLIINLDSGFLPSYPKNGSTWYDISGKGNNASLLNGTTYESTSDGGVVMDGGDEYLNIPYSTDFNQFKSGDFTLETFVRSDNQVYPRSRHPLKIGHTVTSTGTKGWSVGHQTCNNNIEVRVSDGTNFSFTDLNHANLSESTYYHRVFTVSRSNGCATTYYLNGNLVGTHNATSVTGEIYDQNQGSDFGGSGIIFGYNWGWRFIGSVNVIRFYNRALTDAEVLQNYNAQKGRFGL